MARNPRALPQTLPEISDFRARLDKAQHAKAMSWLYERKSWTVGDMCRHLIDAKIIHTERKLLIEAYHAVDRLLRELIKAGKVRVIPSEHLLMYAWVRNDG
jgi:hypothetical protein